MDENWGSPHDLGNPPYFTNKYLTAIQWFPKGTVNHRNQCGHGTETNAAFFPPQGWKYTNQPKRDHRNERGIYVTRAPTNLLPRSLSRLWQSRVGQQVVLNTFSFCHPSHLGSQHARCKRLLHAGAHSSGETLPNGQGQKFQPVVPVNVQKLGHAQNGNHICNTMFKRLC